MSRVKAFQSLWNTPVMRFPFDFIKKFCYKKKSIIKERTKPNSLFPVMLTILDDMMRKNGPHPILNISEMSTFRDLYPPNNKKQKQKSSGISPLISGLIDLIGGDCAKSPTEEGWSAGGRART